MLLFLEIQGHVKRFCFLFIIKSCFVHEKTEMYRLWICPHEYVAAVFGRTYAEEHSLLCFTGWTDSAKASMTGNGKESSCCFSDTPLIPSKCAFSF